MMNIFKRIFGKKEVVDVEQIKNDVLSSIRFRYDHSVRYKHYIVSSTIIAECPSRLQQLSVNGALQLIRNTDTLGNIYYIIVRYCQLLDIQFPIQIFKDSDTEYAENCAREAFEYLTKEI